MKFKSFTIFGYQLLLDNSYDITFYWFLDNSVSMKQLKKGSFSYRFFYFVFKFIK